MTAAHAQPLRCPGCAATPEQAAHHDRLLRIDVDPGQLLALFSRQFDAHLKHLLVSAMGFLSIAAGVHEAYVHKKADK